MQTVGHMRFEGFSFGSIRIDGVTYDHDVVIESGKVKKRNKRPSKPLRDVFGHTPVSSHEEIPWRCRRLVIGTGVQGALPVTDELKRETERRRIELIVLPTAQAIETLQDVDLHRTNAILHVTC